LTPREESGIGRIGGGCLSPVPLGGEHSFFREMICLTHKGNARKGSRYPSDDAVQGLFQNPVTWVSTRLCKALGYRSVILSTCEDKILKNEHTEVHHEHSLTIGQSLRSAGGGA
jgi:hypothetical protein